MADLPSSCNGAPMSIEDLGQQSEISGIFSDFQHYLYEPSIK
jgi:hypothetical protein